MDLVTLLIYLLIGGGAGWLSCQIRMGRGLGVISSVLAGIVGAFLGGIFLNGMGMVPVGILGAVIAAGIGAAAVLGLSSLVFRF